MIFRRNGGDLLFIGRARPHGRARAHAILERMGASEEGMRYLRAILDEGSAGAQGASFADEDVLAALAEQIAQDKLTLVALRPGEAPVPPLQGEAAAEPAPEALPPEEAEAPPPAESTPPAAAEPADEMLASLDAAAQAATLVQAAEEGTPFCEVCEKARTQAA